MLKSYSNYNIQFTVAINGGKTILNFNFKCHANLFDYIFMYMAIHVVTVVVVAILEIVIGTIVTLLISLVN